MIYIIIIYVQYIVGTCTEHIRRQRDDIIIIYRILQNYIKIITEVADDRLLGRCLKSSRISWVQRASCVMRIYIIVTSTEWTHARTHARTHTTAIRHGCFVFIHTIVCII